MIKATIVAIALMLPTQVSAQPTKVEIMCTDISNVAHSIAEARDNDLPIVIVQQVLMGKGVTYEVAVSLTTSVYYVLKDTTPDDVKAAFYSVCLGPSV
jgi:hypothetical protein